eukprot:6666521-Alexandrium_andersonii.AAC.1
MGQRAAAAACGRSSASGPGAAAGGGGSAECPGSRLPSPLPPARRSPPFGVEASKRHERVGAQ